MCVSSPRIPEGNTSPARPYLVERALPPFMWPPPPPIGSRLYSIPHQIHNPGTTAPTLTAGGGPRRQISTPNKHTPKIGLPCCAVLCCAVLCCAVLCCPACPETEFHFPLPTPGKCRLCQSAYTLPTNARDPPWDAYQVTHLSNVLQIARDVLPAFYMTRPTNS